MIYITSCTDYSTCTSKCQTEERTNYILKKIGASIWTSVPLNEAREWERTNTAFYGPWFSQVFSRMDMNETLQLNANSTYWKCVYRSTHVGRLNESFKINWSIQQQKQQKRWTHCTLAEKNNIEQNLTQIGHQHSIVMPTFGTDYIYLKNSKSLIGAFHIKNIRWAMWNTLPHQICY